MTDRVLVLLLRVPAVEPGATVVNAGRVKLQALPVHGLILACVPDEHFDDGAGGSLYGPHSKKSLLCHLLC